MNFKILFEKLFKKKSSNDPIEKLPKKAVDIILSCFRGMELLKLSTVNKKWYKAIAKSEVCMNKIRVTIAEPRFGNYPLFKMEDALLLIEGGRKYKHVMLKHIERQISVQLKLLVAYFPWKSVVLYRHYFPSKMEFINFLGSIEPHVEELILQRIRYNKSLYEIGETNFTFPKMWRLMINNCYSYVYREPFKNVDQLYQLSITTEGIPYYDKNKIGERRVVAMRDMLLRNRGLKMLELCIFQDDFDMMFLDQRFTSRLDFELIVLSVGNFQRIDAENGKVNLVQIDNFVRFLQSQEQTLTTLNLDLWLGNDVLMVAMNDLKLRSFGIENLDLTGSREEAFSELNLFRNETIQRLNIWSHSPRFTDKVIVILKNCRALKLLQLRQIDQTVLNTIVQCNEDLVTLITDTFNAYIPPDGPVLRCLRQMLIKIHCANNFRDMIAVKNEHTNFESVFIKAAKRIQQLNDINFYRR